MAAMVPAEPNFVARQRTLYKATRAQGVPHNASVAQVDAHTQALMAEDENVASCAPYAPLSNFWRRMWQLDRDRKSTSIIDLMSIDTDDGHVTDSSKDE
ncbi:hypothetical protein D1007_39288 [Hordeum vulgare]|nr:hypothetical protein D1007_39288 [Hordeum vulgare]